MILLVCYSSACAEPRVPVLTGNPADVRAAPNAAAPRQVALHVGERVTFGRLLSELVDLEALTYAPEPPFRSLLATSSDPKSLQATPGSEAWFANHDYIVPKAGVAQVLLDSAGPGAITHIWSANPAGTLRIYIDGQEAPWVDAPMRAWLSGQVPPMRKPYAFESGKGYNAYFPIPYQKHIRVTVTSDASLLYYQIDYRQYRDGAHVESLSAPVLAAAEPELQRVAKELENPAAKSGSVTRFTLEAQPVHAAEHTLSPPPGAAAGAEIETLRVTVARDTDLRAARLRMVFDGHESVRVPLGDFFGTHAGTQNVQSLPVSVDALTGTLISRWPMPFAREARIALEPTHGRSVSASFVVTLRPRVWDERSRLFHAQWHPPAWQASKPSHDWTLVDIQGDGTYVGTVLNVLNMSEAWWGEGDEKVFVDDDAFPSHFGTGTEDYFGYAFCYNRPFGTAFLGQTLVGARQNWGRISLYRFSVLDNLPFSRRLRFDLEINHWTESSVAYDAVSYFYARPGASATPRARAAEYEILAPNRDEPAEIPNGPYVCGG